MAELARVVRPGGCIVVGALNPRSPWGIAHHADFGAPPWNRAHFFTCAELRALGVPHGRAHLNAALYAPSAFPLLERIGPLLERFGRAVPMWGAFQVLVVERSPTDERRASLSARLCIGGAGVRAARCRDTGRKPR